MISEHLLMRRMRELDAEALHRWIELGLVVPGHDESGYQFDDVDEARVALICDLHYRMGIDQESLPVILSLLDQLHRTRHSLRALATAVSEQPDDIRLAVTTRTRIILDPSR